MFPLHYESKVTVAASADNVFAYLDDHSRLSKHMTQSSWMMAGSKMEIALDTAQGKAAGSKISLTGKVLGMPLQVDEIVTEYRPPLHKAWETIGVPHLVVIGPYRMGFDIEPQGNASTLRVFIDYAPPYSWIGRLLSFFGKFYARWCTEQMANDAALHFRLAA